MDESFEILMQIPGVVGYGFGCIGCHLSNINVLHIYTEKLLNLPNAINGLEVKQEVIGKVFPLGNEMPLDRNSNSNQHEEYFIDTDGDGHWYIVPESFREKWNEACEKLENGDWMWWDDNAIEHVESIGGHPSLVMFKEFRIK